MVVQIFGDDAILQHPPEGDADAARRPGKLAGQSVIGGQQHRAADNQGEAALDQPGQRNLLAQERPSQEAEHAQPEQDAQRGAVGRGRKRRKQEQRKLLQRGDPLAMRDQEEERQHREPCEDVGKQKARKPGQGRGQDQEQADREQPERLGEIEHAQAELQDPQRRQRLDAEVEPEIRTLAEMQIEAEHGGAARHQIAFIPAGEIAAGVPLQQRIAVPERRRDQEERNEHGRDPDRHRVGRARAQNPGLDSFLPIVWRQHAQNAGTEMLQ